MLKEGRSMPVLTVESEPANILNRRLADSGSAPAASIAHLLADLTMAALDTVKTRLGFADRWRATFKAGRRVCLSLEHSIGHRDEKSGDRTHCRRRAALRGLG